MTSPTKQEPVSSERLMYLITVATEASQCRDNDSRVRAEIRDCAAAMNELAQRRRQVTYYQEFVTGVYEKLDIIGSDETISGAIDRIASDHATVSALQATVAERDATIASLTKQLAERDKTIAGLREALRKYGRHSQEDDSQCALYERSLLDCTCGLDAALAPQGDGHG
jgi:uncharacterized coiled-coil protein SlyX